MGKGIRADAKAAASGDSRADVLAAAVAQARLDYALADRAVDAHQARIRRLRARGSTYVRKRREAREVMQRAELALMQHRAYEGVPEQRRQIMGLLDNYMLMRPGNLWETARRYPDLVRELVGRLLDVDSATTAALVAYAASLVEAHELRGQRAEQLLRTALDLVVRARPERTHRRALIADRVDGSLVLDRYLADLPLAARLRPVPELILRRGPRGATCMILPNSGEVLFPINSSSRPSDATRLADLAAAYALGIPFAAVLAYKDSGVRTPIHQENIAETFARLQVIGPPNLLPAAAHPRA